MTHKKNRKLLPDSSSVMMVIGVIIFIIGVVWITALHFYLAIHDSEYAKHDDSLYATFQMLSHGGWIPIIMAFVGMFIFIIYKDR